jgi:hypothetical protein
VSDRQTEDPLAMIGRHVLEAEGHVARQEAFVAKLVLLYPREEVGCGAVRRAGVPVIGHDGEIEEQVCVTLAGAGDHASSMMLLAEPTSRNRCP